MAYFQDFFLFYEISPFTDRKRSYAVRQLSCEAAGGCVCEFFLIFLSASGSPDTSALIVLLLPGSGLCYSGGLLRRPPGVAGLSPSARLCPARFLFCLLSLVTVLLLLMAFMNLLKADYTGKLGKTVGQKWRNKSVIRSASFGAQPPSASQTAAVRAFECLNRVASSAGHLFSNYITYDRSAMYPHNAFSSQWKVAVAGHTFNPASIAGLYPQSPLLRWLAFAVSTDRTYFEWAIAHQFPIVPGARFEGLVLIFDQYGRVYVARTFTSVAENGTFPVPSDPSLVFYGLLFWGTSESSNRHIMYATFQETAPEPLVQFNYDQSRVETGTYSYNYIPAITLDDQSIASVSLYSLIINTPYGVEILPFDIQFTSLGNDTCRSIITTTSPPGSTQYDYFQYEFGRGTGSFVWNFPGFVVTAPPPFALRFMLQNRVQTSLPNAVLDFTVPPSITIKLLAAP